MFNFFRQQNDAEPPQDVKAIRNILLGAIKNELRKVEGGEGSHIKGIQLYIAATEAERHLYEGAVYFESENKFKNEEVQKIVDDFAIELPHGWTMDILFVPSLPLEASKIDAVSAALFIQTTKRSITKSSTAFIKVLQGEAEKEVYSVSSESGKINIGREKKVQAGDGFYRTNHIAFPAQSDNESNKFVSRQHAHIEWDNNSGTFLLFADEGGVPPRNKIKVRRIGESAVKLQTVQVGFPLQEGDQIILGDSALLEFSFSPTDH